MKNKHYTLFMAVSLPILLTLLVVFFLASSVKNREVYFALVDQIHELKQYNTQLSKDVLRLQSGLISDYDSLVESIQNIEDVLERIEIYSDDITREKSILVGWHPFADPLPQIEQDIARQTNSYKESFVKLRRDVERFKALNATLHNSRNSLPVLVETLLQDLFAREHAAVHIYHVENLLYDESLYLIKRDRAFINAIRKHIGKVREISQIYPELTSLVESVSRHAEIIVSQQTQINLLISNIIAPVHLKRVNDLYASYQAYFDDLYEIGRSYSALGFVLSVVLLGFILWTGFRLFRASRKIKSLNKGLERRIRDRTKALEIEKERSSLILETTKEGIYGLDLEGLVVFANKAALEMTGHAAEEVLFEQVYSLIQHSYEDGGSCPKEKSNLYQSVILGLENTSGTEIFWRKDLTFFPVEYTVSPIIDAKDQLKGAVVVFRDITERKRIEEDLIDAKERAEESTRLKSEFLANMSHEIRTPMNGVIGMTNLLLDTTLTSTQYNYARTAMNSAENLLHLVNDILDFSKIEAGKLELEVIPFDLQVLVEEVADLISVKAREKGLEMLLRFSPEMPRYVMGDPGRVRQVLLNLASNALKFTDKGHILISVEVEGYDQGVYSFHAYVEDTGVGIPANKQAAIFTKFQQADGSTTRKFGGTGLGLAICKQLAAIMNGNVGVESVLGEGSKFWFNFQLQMDEDAEARSHLDFSSDLSGVRAILVDDNEVAQEIAAEQMRAKNMQVMIVSSGEEALETIKEAIGQKTPFEIGVLDYMMPGMDGVALAETIKADPEMKSLSLLMVSSAPSRGDSERMAEIGFSGFLTKPASGQDLVMALSAIQSMREGLSPSGMITRHTLREAHAKKREKRSDDFSLEGAQILLVEDNATNQMVATAMLENMGCHVTPAGNGEEAVSIVKQRHFDLVFMDCNMPVMDGFEATKIIRSLKKWEEHGRTPIIAFTAFAMKGDDQKCFNAGMDDYMTKPIKKQVMIDMLKKWLPEECGITENVSAL